jgi:hypothetical protein
MVAVIITGGLGNQMFQYASARALAYRLKQPLSLDISSFETDIPNVAKRTFELGLFPNINPAFLTSFKKSGFYQSRRWDNRLRKLLGMPIGSVLYESTHSFNETFLAAKPPVLMQGYWQTERYFREVRDIVQKDFEFPKLSEKDINTSLLDEIKQSESVAVHVRRGDYISYEPTHNFHGVCSLSYYESAISYIVEKYPVCRFYFFSDEPEWVQSNLIKEGINGKVISVNKGADSWKDMLLMSNCKHNIIANSSFSWWGAWLNQHPHKKVIAPSKWFKTNDPFFEPNEIVPKSWLKFN